ncbi:hypothetical protein D6C88_09180 [Aureobasidium pullulans]|uniref:Extracellular membrane protein CFEM domain-containing protein n=1 Tax=Aureobasidium pullulans TaxID=5580 RepID=A0AB38LWV2_AURPU|nr:hypothetical protein D6C94_05202 [Aureobasidium pullulans]THZ57031.1 hypothetical protein D6C88_09180 [Aureobasidium pullulans]
MLSNSLISILALTSAVSASPALRRRADPCQDAYKSCIAAGTPEVACSCTLTACVGEDNARNREYCASATANLPKTTAAPSASSSGYACNPAHSYPNGVSCISTAGSLALVTPSASASSSGYACNPAHSYPNGASCISTAGSLALVTPSASASSSGYACNPAHSYPGGAVCTQVGSTLALVTPSPSATAASTTAAAPKASGTNAAAPGSNPKKVDGKTWSLNNVNRYCGDGNTGCDYNFDIVANGKTEHCTVVRMPGSNAATESFSNQPCGDFSVSWGYVKDPAPAYAVLTVVDKAGELAWFGVSNINGQAVTPSNPFGSGQYGNVGPEQVYTYN